MGEGGEGLPPSFPRRREPRYRRSYLPPAPLSLGGWWAWRGEGPWIPAFAGMTVRGRRGRDRVGASLVGTLPSPVLSPVCGRELERGSARSADRMTAPVFVGAPTKTKKPRNTLLARQQPSHGGLYSFALCRCAQPGAQLAARDGHGELVAPLLPQFRQLLPRTGRRRCPSLGDGLGRGLSGRRCPAGRRGCPVRSARLCLLHRDERPPSTPGPNPAATRTRRPIGSVPPG